MDGASRRREAQALLNELSGRYPDIKSRIFGAMQRLPLPEWGPVEPPKGRNQIPQGE